MNRLFENSDPTEKIKANTDTAVIIMAQAQVDAMTDETLKELTQNHLNQAKVQLVAKQLWKRCLTMAM
ncbi:hypothetical protein HPK16_15765 [Listeria sp. W9-0585]|uniref:Uncharacterized protein n=1 Tax=Listeria rustica TaxID=2713503 RepID=A0A7W1T9B6_9LIST|nr:hypothetical protein [Listeria rustica]